MKLKPTLLLITSCLLVANSAHDKGKKDDRTTATYGCAKFDTNQNGILDPDEEDALKKAFTEGDSALKPLDTNNDAKLDAAEIAAIKLPQPEKEKKKKKNA